MTGTPVPPVSVNQRRTPGRSAYPANHGKEVCAAAAINRNNDPDSGCRPRSAAAPRPIIIRCVPFIRLLLRLQLLDAGPRLTTEATPRFVITVPGRDWKKVP